MRIHGLIDSPGDLVLEGRAAGALTVRGQFTLAAEARCQASVQARSARLSGVLVGAVVCDEAIEVLAGAEITGDLKAPVIHIDPGVDIHGEVVRTASPEPVAEPRVQTKASDRATGGRSGARARSDAGRDRGKRAPKRRARSSAPIPTRPQLPRGRVALARASQSPRVRRPRAAGLAAGLVATGPLAAPAAPIPRRPQPRGRVQVVVRGDGPTLAAPGAGA